MYLVFTDESGTNKDSKLVLYGGLCIEENNLIKSEMIITDIIREFFGINNMLEIEVHFVDIFNYIYFNRLPSRTRKQKEFQDKIIPLINENKITPEKLSLFVQELFQFLAKINATFLVSYLKRNDFENEKLKERPIEGYVFKNFLNLLDTFLNRQLEYGVLIADGFYSQLSKKSKKISLFCEEIDFNFFSQKEILFKRILFESTSWRQNLNFKDNFPLKYKFESKIYNVFNSILFIPSHESHLIQISDILLYVMKKYLELKLNFFNKEEITSKINKFFNSNLVDTINYLLDERKLELATLTKDNDTLFQAGRLAPLA